MPSVDPITLQVIQARLAGIVQEMQNALFATGPQFFTNETTITLTVNAAAHMGGTGKIWVLIEYVMP